MNEFVMAMAMLAGPSGHVDHGLLRGGCASTSVVVETRAKVRTVVQATVVRPFATLCANRPHILAHVFAPRAGCAGTVTARTGCAGIVTARTGCSGAIVQTAPDCVVTATFVGPYDQNAKFLGERIQRAAVHRQLVKALQSERAAGMSPAQKAAIKACLADPDLYDASVIKITRTLKQTQLPADVDAKTLGVIGDGHILQLLIDNLPQIIAAIEQIIKLFATGAISDLQMYAMIDQVLDQIPPMIWTIVS